MSSVNTARWHALSAYLDELLELDASHREARLVKLQETDPTAAADLRALLLKHAELDASGFLTRSLESVVGSLVGHRIGSYTLESQLGQGGMGSVWLARRSDGRFEGTVAIKLLNAALIGRVAAERFRREGSVLARLQHPNIAHLLDAGVAASEQPYLVLEHVQGQDIVQWCDSMGLDIRARVRVFLDVLAAVSHAHNNLVVHRDIKPSNVFVTHDGRVKLLDFGIAKLLESAQGGDATLLTREGGWALTPEYAAPEQWTGEVISTATDTYSLGVLLYVLLSGRHPFADKLRSPAEQVRASVEINPARLADAVREGVGSEDIGRRARMRLTTPDKLRRTLQGDLDTIVRKALKKIPQERYLSASAFADDLQRYLDDLPISARPETARYRATKFIRRNRVTVALAVLAASATMMGFGAALTQARRATRESLVATEQSARAEAVRDFLFEVFNEARPSTPGRQPPTVLEVVKDAAKAAQSNPRMNVVARTELLTELGSVMAAQGDVTASRAVLAHAFQDAEQRLGSNAVATLLAGRSLAEAVMLTGDYQQARALLAELVERTPSSAPGVRAQLLTLSAYLYSLRLQRDESLSEAEEAVALCRVACSPGDLSDALTALANAQTQFNQLEMAIANWQEVLALERRRYGPSHIRVASVLTGMSRALTRLQQLERAEALLNEALAIDEAVLDADDHRKALHLNALVAVLRAKGDYPRALEASRESLRISRASLGPEHPEVSTGLNAVGFLLGVTGDYRGAEEALGASLRMKERIYGPDNLQTAVTRGNYGDVLARAGETIRGEGELRRAVENYREAGSQPELHATMLEKLALWFVDAGNGQEGLRSAAQLAALAEKFKSASGWMARAALASGRSLLILQRTEDARDALDEASRLATSQPMPAERLAELLLAKAVVRQRLTGGTERPASTDSVVAAMASLQFPPARLRAYAEAVRRELSR